MDSLFNETVCSARIFLEFIKMVVVRIRYGYSQLYLVQYVLSCISLALHTKKKSMS